jgi:hypothetical protein
VTRGELETPGLTVLSALIRDPHGRTVAQLEKRKDPPEPAADAPFAERMRHRTSTAAGRALYKLRQQTIKPVFGIIKEVLGFRRFSLRGQKKVSLEWNLVCLAYNVKRLHCLGASCGGMSGGPGGMKPVAPRSGGRLAAPGPVQTAPGRVLAGPKRLEIGFCVLFARLRVRILTCRSEIQHPGLFLNQTGC